MASDYVNRPIVFLSTLLTSILLLGSVADVDCTLETCQNRSHPLPIEDPHLSTLDECNRECRVGEPSKTCYHHFIVEFYTVLGGACKLCTPDKMNTASNDCQCVLADGFERTVMTVNRMLPGPSIQVCLGDKVIIDVTNHADGLEMTIHWHGLFQNGTQYYDGVPFVTQCPIMHGNSFRYEWYANNEGTHFWHAHIGMHKMDGVHGSLVVRVPRSEEPNSDYYDYDLPEHVILFADWMHDLSSEHFPGHLGRNAFQLPVSVLINGRGNFRDPITGNVTDVPLENFIVREGYRYRMRFINSFCSTCPAQVTIEGHSPMLIAVDGVPVEPVKINSANSVAGERFDIVITADQAPRCYWIQIRTFGECIDRKVHQLATFCYAGEQDQSSSTQPTYDQPLPSGVVLGPLDGRCNMTRDDAVCMNHLKSAHPVDEGILKRKPDFKFFYEVSFHNWTTQELFRPNTYNRYSVPIGSFALTALINNISFVSPKSPVLSQMNDNRPEQFCTRNNHPANCGHPCTCTQMYRIPRNAIVECILTDGIGIPVLTHPIHMHGYAFHVMCMGKSPDRRIKKMRADHARYLDSKHKLYRNFDRPPLKDTIAIPTAGYAVIRFRADNPGFWLFHCHFLFHQLVGMEMLFQVGDLDDLPPVPPKFPTCGDYLPPFVRDKW